MFEDKLPSMSLKDYLVRRISKNMDIPHSMVNDIVNFQTKTMLEKFSQPDIFSVEMSGFGKFLFNKKKALKFYNKQLSKIDVFKKCLEESTTPQKKASFMHKLENTERVIRELKPRIDVICQQLENTLSSSQKE